jgi:eukaryotic-like serine/threonine-protein kinase
MAASPNEQDGMTMAIQQWERVKELVHQAMQLEAEHRARFLDDACSSDAALRAEIESLLLADEHVRSSFLQPKRLSADSLAALEPGQIFAQRFQLVRKLGEGGMGQVWLAEQTSPVRRQVALKLIKAGMYDQAVVQRFQSERQSLAIMDHPAIAKVFDAGATPQGQPYFVMEYVPGLPITEYCDQKKLRIRDRLELFIQACEGVQHAHQKAIIHRDLKPANILVVEVDGKPTPRIIDFGLAKATTPRDAGESVFTQLGHFVGTPAYMSPEQADPAAQDVDTRADVYSLGVVLYVLLAGLQPFETRQRQKQPLDELLRKLREEEPPPPSNKVSMDRDTSLAIAEGRGTEAKQLVSLLRGDLDWITMKALEKDRGRRYGAPSELAADVRRYLNHELVVARPASAGYRVQKYVRRHRVGAGVTAGLVLLLAGFSILQAVELRRITRERDRAARITDFMTGMFKVSDPSQARGNSVTAREILDQASNDAATGLAKDPEVQSQMMQVMARTYENLGLYARAHELAKRALEARLSLLGSNDPKTLESMAQLGWILAREGHDIDAEKMERQALAGELRFSRPDSPLTLEITDHLAMILLHQGRYSEAEKLERDCIDVGTHKFGQGNAQTLQSMNHLGAILLAEARDPEAEQVYRQLLDVEGRVWGPDHPETLKAQANLAVAVQRQGRFAEAEQLYRQALAAHQRVFGPEHQNTARTMENLAIVLGLEGHAPNAEQLFRQVVAIRSRTLGPDHPDTLNAESNLANLLLREGHVHEAEELQRGTLAVQFRVLGPQNPYTLTSQANLAAALLMEARYAEAEKIAREAFEVELRTLGPQHPYTQDAMRRLGMAMAYQHRYGEASRLFRDAIEKQSNPKQQGNAFSVWYAFACVAVAGKHDDDALQYLAEAINRGYKDADGLVADDDLKNLRPNPKFQQLVAELKRSPTKAQTQ